MAAEAAEAAGAQGAFWAMHDMLLAAQDELTRRDLKRYAEELGLDLERFVDDIRRHEHADRVAEDVGERRRQRRGRHAELLHQRPAPPGRLRPRHAQAGGARGARPGSPAGEGGHLIRRWLP